MVCEPTARENTDQIDYKDENDAHYAEVIKKGNHFKVLNYLVTNNVDK